MRDLTRFPQWVRDEIRNRDMRIRELEEQLSEYQEGRHKASVIEIQTMPGEEPRYLDGRDGVIFHVGDKRSVTIRVREEYPDARQVVDLNCVGGWLTIVPQATNAAQVEVRR